MRRFYRAWTICVMAAIFLSGCGGISEEMLTQRDSAITMMENGDYEEAAAVFDSLVAEATSVTEFELDILKYRAEAEYLLGDYAAAAYTYDILNQVDEERPEYCYFGAMSLAQAGDLTKAQEMLKKGRTLEDNNRKDEKDEKNKTDEGHEAVGAASGSVGYVEAVLLLGNALFDNGDKETANALYDELIAGGHATTEVYNRLVTDAMTAGDYEEALKLVEKGKQLTDGLAKKEICFNEAVCYEYLGNWSKALELFEAYVAEFGNDEKAEHEIAFLRTR